MKNNISKFKECANCGACYNVCPTNAISVLGDDLFYTLNVDNDKCIDCGKCMRVCPVNAPQQQGEIISAIGGYSKDSSIVKSSSSGGAFSVFANYVLSKNGVVFGAAFSEDNRCIEIKSTDEITLEQLLRSKYVESLVGESFSKVKEYLENNRFVLFCGCPCQVAGLIRFLGKDYPNLITCDFSCGGLPSHKMYEEYISSLEKKYKSKTKSVNFRPKTFGWETYAIKVCFDNRKEYNRLANLDPFFYGFIHKHYTVRDNCLTCRFADNHYSDIILADFWLYKKLSNLEKENGLSLVLSNSEKGENLLNKLKNKFEFEQIDTKKSCYNIRKPNYSKDFYKNRENFLKQYEKIGLSAIKPYLPNGINKNKIIIKNLIKKLLNYIKGNK